VQRRPTEGGVVAASWVESREARRRGTDGVSSGRAGLVATTGGAPWLSTTHVECGADMGAAGGMRRTNTSGTGRTGVQHRCGTTGDMGHATSGGKTDGSDAGWEQSSSDLVWDNYERQGT
jgi:hypothetical protein